MSIDLSSYDAIGTGLFVKIEVGYYKSNAGATPVAQDLLFSDYYKDITIGDDTYLGIGNLVGISETTSDIAANGNDLTITISGIPNSSIAEIVHSRIKGSPVSVYRYVFNAATGQPLAISGNPAGRFFGIVNNYALEEEYNVEERTATNTISLVCSNKIDVLENKVAGRKTNGSSHRAFYSSDPSMDRVATIVGTTFNFGAP